MTWTCRTAFNRKEQKTTTVKAAIWSVTRTRTRNAGGNMIATRTAIRESMEVLQANGTTLAGMLIRLDRQEARARRDFSDSGS